MHIKWGCFALLLALASATNQNTTDGVEKGLVSTETDEKTANETFENGTTSNSTAEKTIKGTKTPVEFYRNLFKLKRRDQIRAIESLLIMDDVEKQHKMIGVMMRTIIKTISHGRGVLMEGNYNAGDPFPEEGKIKDGLSLVLENTALFTDLVVRFPFVTDYELKENRDDWTETMKWAKEVCEKSGVYVEKHENILHSLGQELGLDDPDPNYKNPFRVKRPVDPITAEERLRMHEEKKRKERLASRKNTVKKKKAGPKLHKTEL